MNASNYLGFNDWRMPATLLEDPTCSAQRAEAPDVRKTYSNSWRPGLLRLELPRCKGTWSRSKDCDEVCADISCGLTSRGIQLLRVFTNNEYVICVAAELIGPDTSH
jgi:hypothetical protein